MNRMKLSLTALQMIFIGLFCAGILSPVGLEAASCKVLVVLSYHDEYPWQADLRKGVQTVLPKSCEVKYFSLDTKRNTDAGQKKAQEAYELYLGFTPDAVIAADDAAQSLFVVPYLKNKVKTPVIFCGVNGELEDYGYPASNVTGVLERWHTKETMEFLKKLAPSIKKVAFIIRNDPQTSAPVVRQFKADIKTYPLIVTAIGEPETLEEALSMVEQFKAEVDLLFLEHFEGIKDKDGNPHSNKEVIGLLLKAFGNKPSACANAYTVDFGCLGAVVETGYEQGALAARLVMKTLQGTPVGEIAVTRNYEGIKVINVTTMKDLGLDPAPEILRGVKFVKTNGN